MKIPVSEHWRKKKSFSHPYLDTLEEGVVSPLLGEEEEDKGGVELFYYWREVYSFPSSNHASS